MEIISKCIYKEEYDTSVSLSMVIRSKLTLNEIYRHFDYSCGCEHDCCGCWNTHVWSHKTTKVGPHMYRIHMRSYRNI